MWLDLWQFYMLNIWLSLKHVSSQPFCFLNVVTPHDFQDRGGPRAWQRARSRRRRRRPRRRRWDSRDTWRRWSCNRRPWLERWKMWLNGGWRGTYIYFLIMVNLDGSIWIIWIFSVWLRSLFIWLVASYIREMGIGIFSGDFIGRIWWFISPSGPTERRIIPLVETGDDPTIRDLWTRASNHSQGMGWMIFEVCPMYPLVI